MSSLIRFDWALKRLLRNKAGFVVLEGFISTIIQKDVKIVEVLKSESSLKHDKQKQNGLGILCETKNEKPCIVEVQVNCQISFLLDMLFTTNETVNEYFEQGKYYGVIPQVYSINIGHFESSLGTDYVYKSTLELVGLGLHNNNELGPNELQKDDKLIRDVNNICPKYWVLDVASFKGIIKSPLDEWIYYLKNDAIKDSFTAKGLKEAKELLALDSLSQEDKYLYMCEMSLRDASSLATTLRLEKEEGKAEGILIGEAKGNIEGKLKNLLSLYLENLIDLETATKKIQEELSQGYDDLVKEYLAKLGE